jgi:hypothetical protein
LGPSITDTAARNWGGFIHYHYHWVNVKTNSSPLKGGSTLRDLSEEVT